MTTYYVTLRRPGALWNSDKTTREQPFKEWTIFLDARERQ